MTKWTRHPKNDKWTRPTKQWRNPPVYNGLKLFRAPEKTGKQGYFRDNFISNENIYCDPSKESSLRDNSNEGSQCMFLGNIAADKKRKLAIILYKNIFCDPSLELSH